MGKKISWHAACVILCAACAIMAIGLAAWDADVLLHIRWYAPTGASMALDAILAYLLPMLAACSIAASVIFWVMSGRDGR